MYVNALVTLAFVFLGGVQAAPAGAKRDDSTSLLPSDTPTPTIVPQVDIPNLGPVNATYIPIWSSAGVNLDPAQTPDPTSLISFIQANQQQVESVIGTKTVAQIEAALVFEQVTSALGPSPAGISVFQAVSQVTPVVVVSSVGGPAITVATGTASASGGAFETTFAGHVFTAAPAPSSNNAARTSFGLNIPGSLLARGGAAAAGSILLGALAAI
ncbi:hypothetical protein C8Q74DRAFT_1365043 [Fomes fomentarius]|nr:hypothetical protein C8Q74DRAFT_1365043 [Fomes fomentarius]